MSELADMIFEQARALNHQFQAGIRAGKEINRLAHSALKAAYTSALKDEHAKIPTTLHIAIENILRLREEEQMNAYVDAGVKREQAERHEGRADHDLDVAGRPLRAGS